jgi:hypothetical protein
MNQDVNVVTPIVHMNGTGKQTLLNQREDVYTALREVERCICQMAPNGRDYYPEPGRMELAQAQHARRLGMLKQLMSEMVAEAEAIQEAGR